MPKIIAKDISHYYLEKGREHLILNELELSVGDHEKVAIMGASGSGKSTLLHILSGLLKPKKGEVYYDDIKLHSLSSSQRTQLRGENMGFMFQSQHFFPELSLMDNVALPLLLQGKENAKEKAKEMLSLLKLDEKLHDQYPQMLSGGEQARGGLARALIHSPKVLFLDEPTSALDNELTHEIFKDILLLQEKLGFSIIAATHDTELVKYFDKIKHLKKGKL